MSDKKLSLFLVILGVLGFSSCYTFGPSAGANFALLPVYYGSIVLLFVGVLIFLMNLGQKKGINTSPAIYSGKESPILKVVKYVTIVIGVLVLVFMVFSFGFILFSASFQKI